MIVWYNMNSGNFCLPGSVEATLGFFLLLGNGCIGDLFAYNDRIFSFKR